MTLLIEGGHWAPRRYSQLPLHRNEVLELVVVQRGSALWQVDGQEYAIEEGQCFFTFPWQEHGSAVPLDQGIDALWLVLAMERRDGTWRFRHPAINEVDCSVIFSGESVLIEQRPCRGVETLRSYVGHLIEALGQEQAGWLSQHLSPLVFHEWHRLVLSPASTNHPPVIQPQQVSNAIRRAWRTICHQHDKPWTIEQMADLAGVGRSQFSARITTLTGSSPIQALNRERLAAACDDLLSSEASVAQIA